MVLTHTSQSKGSYNSRFGPYFGSFPIFQKPPLLANTAKLPPAFIASKFSFYYLSVITISSRNINILKL